MADDDSRRGDTSVADADSTKQSTNSSENPQVNTLFLKLANLSKNPKIFWLFA